MLPSLPAIPTLGSFFPTASDTASTAIGTIQSIAKGDVAGAVDKGSATILGISITRLITIVVGVIVVAIGISMLRTTQTIIETGSKVAEKAAVLAA